MCGSRREPNAPAREQGPRVTDEQASEAIEGAESVGGLAAQLRELRAALLGAIESLPETRLYRKTDREGWTLKHELSWLAAADEELEHVLERLREAEGALTLQLRRFRGERMWEAQELRLAPLREHLAATGHRAAAAVEEHAHHVVDRPLGIAGRELATAADYLSAHLAVAREGLERVRQAME